MSPFPRLSRPGLDALLYSILAAAWSAFLPSVAVAQPLPQHLDIRSAVLFEQGPMDPGDVASREVVLRIVMEAVPPCNAGTGYLSYGLLIDTDRDPATGVEADELAPLGAEARISAECDPGSGTFTSPLGAVTVGPDPDTGGALLELTSTVGLLPSVDFHWLAYAQEDSTLTRLPEPPNVGAWKTIERAIP